VALDLEEEHEEQVKRREKQEDPIVSALFRAILEIEHVDYRKEKDEVRDEFCKNIGVGPDKCGEVWAEVEPMLNEALKEAKSKVRDYLKNSTDVVFDLLTDGIALDMLVVSNNVDVGDPEFYTTESFDQAFVKFEEEVEKARSMFEETLRERFRNISNYIRSKYGIPR